VASYIVQRSEAIGALFFLSALLFYLRAERCTGHEPRWGWFAACFVAACFGIVSKETTASLPLVLLLFHFTVRPGGDPGTQPGWRRWGLFVALLLPVLYGLYLSRHVLSSAYSFGAGIEPEEQRAWLYIPTAGFQLEGITPWSYLITQFGVIVWYLRLFLFPSRQCFDYGWPIRDSFWSTDVLAPLAILAGLTLAAILARRRYPVATLGFGWFLLTLSPSSSVIPIRDAAFEYRMYLPLIGLALVAVAAGSDAIDWLVRRGRLAAESVWQIGAAVAATWIFALAGASIWRNHILQDETRLALDSVAVAPLHWRNQFALGDVLNKQGREDEAIAAFEKAVELGPEQGTPRVVLGALYGKRGRLEEAESVLLLATDVAEESVAAAAYRQLGFLYKAMNHPGSAVMMFRESLQRKPSWAPLRLELWRLFLYEGDWRSAAIEINEAAESQPAYKTSMAGDLARTNYLAAVVAFENGEKTLATWFALAAVRYQSEFPEAQHYLAYIRSREGDWEAARRLMDSVVSQRPDDGLAAANWDRTRREEILVAPASRQSLGG
jgi:tetratricopeptide (TPR) repeat protein